MYLSKVWLDWHWAKDPYQQHRALWQLFPDRAAEKRDFLFRVEDWQSRKGAAVLMQSALAPATTEVAQVLATKTVAFTIPIGRTLRFKLRANPVKTIKDERQRLNRKGEVKTCRVPLVQEEQQLQWLMRKLAPAARLESAWVSKEQPLYFRKGEMAGKIQPICFEGLLTIEDTAAWQILIQQGIGPGKAMGCGLLSVAPA
ncbi:type I-E CRISPR-associated protein Cas6/Cse3/CasE [Balneatrix alpica]|uniref:type I-E CRISPR-associated protein Cas6/Cse3/CasE n=1 Tax=Balneatrix alpica TaxID=75684 RepID=UPI00273940C4|nr:type I-E CRISPR-associated protein Cas6/Cse3/CasE [Balneatrix alpica]